MRRHVASVDALGFDVIHDGNSGMFIVSDTDSNEYGTGMSEDEAYNDYVANLMGLAQYYFRSTEDQFSPRLWLNIQAAARRLGFD